MHVPDIDRHILPVDGSVLVPDEVKILPPPGGHHRQAGNRYLGRRVDALDVVIDVVIGPRVDLGHGVVLDEVVHVNLVADQPVVAAVAADQRAQPFALDALVIDVVVGQRWDDREVVGARTAGQNLLAHADDRCERGTADAGTAISAEGDVPAGVKRRNPGQRSRQIRHIADAIATVGRRQRVIFSLGGCVLLRRHGGPPEQAAVRRVSRRQGMEGEYQDGQHSH